MSAPTTPGAAARRDVFDPEHEDYRASVRTFFAREVVPFASEWEAEGVVPRELFARAAAHGFVAMSIPEEHGGAGVEDYRFNVVVLEEAERVGATAVGLGLALVSDICVPHLLEHGTPDQHARWLPGIATGETITAIAMTEPGTGSDLAEIRTTALCDPGDPDHYVLNGAKTFITNGVNADLVIVAAKTDPARRHDGLSLLVVERGMGGFTRGRNLDKVGLHAQDTAELFFEDVRVPVANRLGAEGEGFRFLTGNLAQERLSIAVGALAAARAAFGHTLEYVKERHAFGRPVGTFQSSRFAMAEMHAEIEVASAFLDDCLREHVAGTLGPERAALAKWWCTEAQGRVLDRCLQLHGGYGYMSEYPIARAWADGRVSRIYGGTTEIMKEIVGRSLGLG